jgi:3-demethoxyubiquinol 3-hydroxylase
MPYPSSHYTPLDLLLHGIGQGLKHFSLQPFKDKLYCSQKTEDKLPTMLFRINHVGEICAQGLYLGQALSTNNPTLAQDFLDSAKEEELHLQYCRDYLQTHRGHSSVLAPFWFGSSLCIGWIAGCFGDAYSLGFLQETEEQVMRHFDNHIATLKASPLSSYTEEISLLEKMKEDERQHAAYAASQGACALPKPIPAVMGKIAAIMTSVSAWL